MFGWDKNEAGMIEFFVRIGGPVGEEPRRFPLDEQGWRQAWVTMQDKEPRLAENVRWALSQGPSGATPPDDGKVELEAGAGVSDPGKWRQGDDGRWQRQGDDGYWYLSERLSPSDPVVTSYAVPPASLAASAGISQSPHRRRRIVVLMACVATAAILVVILAVSGAFGAGGHTSSWRDGYAAAVGTSGGLFSSGHTQRVHGVVRSQLWYVTVCWPDRQQRRS